MPFAVTIAAVLILADITLLYGLRAARGAHRAGGAR
jgi:hypothetical protein